jgi:hypothetical protein
MNATPTESFWVPLPVPSRLIKFLPMPPQVLSYGSEPDEEGRTGETEQK